MIPIPLRFPLILAAVAVLTLLPEPCAAQSNESCNENSIVACETYNRVCLRNFVDSNDCGYCLPGFIEINSVCYSIDAFETNPDVMEDLFLYLLDEYLPDYAGENVERQDRLSRFIAMSYIISEWNIRNDTDFELGINSETFLTADERKRRLGVNADLTYDDKNFDRFASENSNGRALRYVPNGRSLQQAAVDWHEMGYTTRVKNQGLCGCCWAVSTAAAIESALLITNQTKATDTDADSISFQQMIACDAKNLGCDGGNIFYATRYAWENNDFGNGNYGGLTSFAEYPFENFLGQDSPTCNAQGKTPMVYLNYPKVVTSINDRSSFEERRDLVMAAVSQQPITTTMKSECDVMSLYKGGVLTSDSGCECCDSKCIDHAVVIVGYDTTAPIPYWKIRNSWGPNFGESGHFRVAMNDAGCGWGLFGILAESALMEDAYSTLEALPPRPSWWARAGGFQKTLVIAGSILGFISLVTCTVGGWKSYKHRKEIKDMDNHGRVEDDGK